jgi:hypothetical protein
LPLNGAHPRTVETAELAAVTAERKNFHLS